MSGATSRVAPTSTRDNGRRPGAPKATIQAIIDAHDLEPGDEIRVDTGTYNLTISGTYTDSSGSSPATLTNTTTVTMQVN